MGRFTYDLNSTASADNDNEEGVKDDDDSVGVGNNNSCSDGYGGGDGGDVGRGGEQYFQSRFGYGLERRRRQREQQQRQRRVTASSPFNSTVPRWSALTYSSSLRALDSDIVVLRSRRNLTDQRFAVLQRLCRIYYYYRSSFGNIWKWQCRRVSETFLPISKLSSSSSSSDSSSPSDLLPTSSAVSSLTTEPSSSSSSSSDSDFAPCPTPENTGEEGDGDDGNDATTHTVLDLVRRIADDLAYGSRRALSLSPYLFAKLALGTFCFEASFDFFWTCLGIVAPPAAESYLIDSLHLVGLTVAVVFRVLYPAGCELVVSSSGLLVRNACDLLVTPALEELWWRYAFVGAWETVFGAGEYKKWAVPSTLCFALSHAGKHCYPNAVTKIKNLTGRQRLSHAGRLSEQEKLDTFASAVRQFWSGHVLSLDLICPVYEESGLVASIGAHATWKVLVWAATTAVATLLSSTTSARREAPPSARDYY